MEIITHCELERSGPLREKEVEMKLQRHLLRVWPKMVEAVILTTVVEVELWELEMSNTVWTKKAVSTGELGLEG